MATKDKVYKCLSPVGNRNAVDTFPLAPRLNTIEGKTIYLSVCGEPDITLALEKRLKVVYPKVNWKTKRTYITDPVPLSEEEMKTADALIQGVAW
ncbi:MAG: hypothetical protein AABZ77_00950 [Chloroflexota bacterium]